MTIAQAREQYNIPAEIAECYESIRGAGGDLTDEDIRNLSLLVTLRDVGLSKVEAAACMREIIKGGCPCECVRILDRRRAKALEQIHVCEKQVRCIDFLRHELKKERKNGQD